MTNNQKTPAEKLKELEENRKAFMAHVEEENNKFKEERQKLILEEKERHRREEQDWRNNLAKTITEEYEVVSNEVADLIVERAWEEGHSYGYNEVIWKAEDLAEFVEKIVGIVKVNR